MKKTQKYQSLNKKIMNIKTGTIRRKMINDEFINLHGNNPSFSMHLNKIHKNISESQKNEVAVDMNLSGVWKQYVQTLVESGKCFFQEDKRSRENICNFLQDQIIVTKNLFFLLQTCDNNKFQDFLGFIDVNFPEKELLKTSLSNFDGSANNELAGSSELKGLETEGQSFQLRMSQNDKLLSLKPNSSIDFHSFEELKKNNNSGDSIGNTLLNQNYFKDSHNFNKSQNLEDEEKNKKNFLTQNAQFLELFCDPNNGSKRSSAESNEEENCFKKKSL